MTEDIHSSQRLNYLLSNPLQNKFAKLSVKSSVNHTTIHGILKFVLIFFKDFIYLLLESGRDGEREGEKHQCVVASHAPPTMDLQPRHVP